MLYRKTKALPPAKNFSPGEGKKALWLPHKTIFQKDCVMLPLQISFGSSHMQSVQSLTEIPFSPMGEWAGN